MPIVLAPIDLAKNELRQAVIQNLASPGPASPVKGQIWFDSTNNILKWYDGSQWVAAQGGAGAVPADTVTTEAIGDVAAPGASTLYSRGDHKHGMPAFGAVTAEATFGAGSANGSAATIARADHTHGNPAHAFADHSAYRLDQWAQPTADVYYNNHKITGLLDPTVATDAATKQYVDLAIQGLDGKASVKAASTANLTLSGTQTVDGIALIAGDRVLCKDQTTTANNGIYVVASGAWTRATDMDAWPEVPSAYVWVEQGTVNADTGWMCTADQGGVIGTNPVTWTQFSGAGQITAGAGLTKTGNTIDAVAGDTTLTVAADSIVVNTAVIATVASLANYVPTSRNVATGTGLTGGGTLAADKTLAIDTAVVTRKAAFSLAGSVAYATGEVFTHNLNTRDIAVTVINNASPWNAIEVDWEATTVNTVTIRYNSNVTNPTGYRVLVVG